MNGDAFLSQDRRYRYLLRRNLSHPMYEGERPCLFIMLNPSTADEKLDDPTIRRCTGFALGWKCTDLWVVNLFAFRATNPKDLMTAEDPVGPENDGAIAQAVHFCQKRGMIVAAWGAHRLAYQRGKELSGKYHPLACLGRTASGAPRHPLYVRSDQQLEILHYGR